MSRVKHCHRALPIVRLNLECLEDRQVPASFGGFRHVHGTPPGEAIAAFVKQVHAQKAVVHDVVKMAVAEKAELITTVETQTQSLLNPVPENSSVGHVVRTALAESTDLVATAPKEIVRLANTVSKQEAIKEIIHTKQELIHRVDRIVEALAEHRLTTPELPRPQLPEFTADHDHPGLKPRFALSSALLDLTLTRSQNTLPALQSGVFDFEEHADAGHLVPELSEGEDPEVGGRAFVSKNTDEFDLFFSSQKSHADDGGASAFFATTGRGEETDIDWSEGLQQPALSAGPSIAGTGLDGAIAGFLAQLDALGREIIDALNERGAVTWLVGLGLGMASMEIVRRQVKRRGKTFSDFDTTISSWVPGVPLPHSA